MDFLQRIGSDAGECGVRKQRCIVADLEGNVEAGSKPHLLPARGLAMVLR
jgi:hypothetical protein